MVDSTCFERLAYLIIQHIVFFLLPPPCDGVILRFGEQKLRLCRLGIAHIGKHEIAVTGLEWIASVVQPLFDGLCYGTALSDVMGL